MDFRVETHALYWEKQAQEYVEERVAWSCSRTVRYRQETMYTMLNAHGAASRTRRAYASMDGGRTVGERTDRARRFSGSRSPSPDRGRNRLAGPSPLPTRPLRHLLAVNQYPIPFAYLALSS